LQKFFNGEKVVCCGTKIQKGGINFPHNQYYVRNSIFPWKYCYYCIWKYWDYTKL